MSVILYEYREFEGVYNQLVKIPKLKDVVMNNNYVKEYNSRQMPSQMKYSFEDVLGRLLWYMYVANTVAYSLQYQRNEDIFTPEEDAEKYTLDEAKQKFGSFMYNIYTNNGTVFLSEDWLGLAMDIKKFIYPKDFEKGGEVIEYSKVYEILKDKIDDSVEDIESTYELAVNTKGEEVEYKSRDGFIPFTNGGYSSRWFEYSNILEGSGINLPTASLDEKIEEFRERNREYGFERFEEEYPEIVEELGGIENVNYSALVDAGYSNEADDLDMFMQDDDDSIMMEVEAFYYNPNNDRGEDGKHTIQLSGVVNLESPYHRSGNLEDYIEHRFTFDSYKELEDKLDKALAKVVSWFEGDMYDENPRELKIRRMEAGGTLPTPFGQAGLVGETGTLNEMELFAMGGGLPQGVHQYYANTYNPAYPTPHGYAKGGKTEKINWSEYYKKGGLTKTSMSKEMQERLFDENGERKIDRESIKVLTDYLNSLPQTKSMYFNESTQKYTPSRQKVHNEILQQFKDNLVCIESDEPIAILMGGSPASGKSTFLRKYAPYLLSEELLRIDADEVRSQLPEYEGWNASQTHLETKDIVNTLLSDRTIGMPCTFDVIYDGTMNNTKSYIPLIKLLRKLGYKIYVVYIDNVPKDVIEKRALERYKKSGRFVPLEVIDDFFSKGKTALNEIKKLVDGYMVVDGGSNDYRIIEEGGMKLPRNRAYSQIGYPTKELKMKIGGKTQGYNDKLDESLGNTKGKRSTKEQNYKDRRNESEAMEKKGGKRKYARVKTMDKGNRKNKMKTPMTLAKAIRREGEKWQDAVKRASAMIRKDS